MFNKNQLDTDVEEARETGLWDNGSHNWRIVFPQREVYRQAVVGPQRFISNRHGGSPGRTGFDDRDIPREALHARGGRLADGEADRAGLRSPRRIGGSLSKERNGMMTKRGRIFLLTDEAG